MSVRGFPDDISIRRMGLSKFTSSVQVGVIQPVESVKNRRRKGEFLIFSVSVLELGHFILSSPVPGLGFLP